jgi:peptidoglycan/LPS O-acetylase OafA/YrhL
VTRREVVRRVLLAGATLLLIVVAWLTLSGGLRQIPRSHTFGRRAETIVQLACGMLSVLSVLTCFWWRRWSRQVLTAWAAALAASAGLSSLVWGPPDPIVGLVFAAGALLLALGIIRLLKAGLAA